MKEDNGFNLMEEKDLIHALKSLPEARVPKDISEKIMDGISEYEKSSEKKKTLFFYPALAAGIAILVFMAVFSFKAGFIRFTQEDSAVLFENGEALLSQDRLEESLLYFQKAVMQDPDDAKIHFFLGVNHGRLNNFQKEQDAYLKAIEKNPDYLQAYYFLGHSYMSQGNWEKASFAYDRVLSIEPGFDKALFNKGLALKKSGKTNKAMAAWKKYLKYQKTGSWALRAVAHLNAHGDFTFRPFRMGKKRMILGPFQKEGSNGAIQVSEESLNRIGKSLKVSSDLDLFVIVYIDEEPDFARLNAQGIKKRLLDQYPAIRSDRVKLSWFGQEDLVSVGKTTFSLERSIRFLGVKKDILDKGVNS